MPTKRTRRTRAIVEQPLGLLRYFESGENPPREVRFFWSDERQRAAWADAREELLSEWIATAPGTRPWAWWRWDAPRADRSALVAAGFSGLALLDKIDPRRCVNGPSESWLPVATCPYGLPGFEPGALFESESEYLKRHGLLLPGERRRLSHTDFEPVALELDPEPA